MLNALYITINYYWNRANTQREGSSQRWRGEGEKNSGFGLRGGEAAGPRGVPPGRSVAGPELWRRKPDKGRRGEEARTLTAKLPEQTRRTRGGSGAEAEIDKFSRSTAYGGFRCTGHRGSVTSQVTSKVTKYFSHYLTIMSHFS